jgi:site-specific recombinase XerD
LFLGFYGLSLKSVRKPFSKLLKKAEIEDIRFHHQHHTLASHFVMSGDDLLAVKEILGHSDMKIVMHYVLLASPHKVK